MAELGIALNFTVGVDQDFIDLLLQAINYMRHHGFPKEIQQAFINTAHATAKATCQNNPAYTHTSDTSGLARVLGQAIKRSAPVKIKKCLPCERPIMVMPTSLAISQPMRVRPERD